MNNTAINDLIARGALFVVNHSGGKDSQAMYTTLRTLVPRDQLVVIHATLGDIEWAGTQEHITDTVDSDVEIIICRNPNKDFLGMVEQRGMWPSPKYRQCTSDLKRGPIETAIRRHLKKHPEFGGLIVSCVGLRAEESSQRKKTVGKGTLKLSKTNSKAGREWYDWLPIADLTEAEVFQIIADAGQEPHWAYAAGMSRLSCAFCIMSSQSDLETAARLRPALLTRIVEIEERIGHTFRMPKKGHAAQTLDQVVGHSRLQVLA